MQDRAGAREVQQGKMLDLVRVEAEAWLAVARRNQLTVALTCVAVRRSDLEWKYRQGMGKT